MNNHCRLGFISCVLGAALMVDPYGVYGIYSPAVAEMISRNITVTLFAAFAVSLYLPIKVVYKISFREGLNIPRNAIIAIVLVVAAGAEATTIYAVAVERVYLYESIFLIVLVGSELSLMSTYNYYVGQLHTSLRGVRRKVTMRQFRVSRSESRTRSGSNSIASESDSLLQSPQEIKREEELNRGLRRTIR